MKPRSFRYHVASNVGHALELLDEHGERTKVLAGGQSLVPLMNMRQIAPADLIDINECTDLAYVHDEGDYIAIGALTRYRTVEESSLVKTTCGLLAEAIHYVAYPAVRNRGTIGGTLGQADPTAEVPTVVAALEGELKILGPQGGRLVSFRDFCAGPNRALMDSSELILEVRVPKLVGIVGWGFREVSRRYNSTAIVSVASALRFEGLTVMDAWISVSGLAPIPVKAREAEEILRGRPATESCIHNAAEVAVQSMSEQFASSNSPHRMQLVKTLVRRALADSVRRASEMRGDAS